MPRIGNPPKDFYAITEGLNTLKSGVRIGETELRNTQNIRYFPVGGFKWRPGYSQLNSTAVTGAAAMTGLYMARFDSLTNVAFATAGSALYKMDSMDGTWDNITGALTITSGQNNIWNFATLNNTVVCANDVDTCIQINSSLTAAVIGGGVPFTSALAVVEHRGYMFYLNTVVSATRYRDRLYFSDINTPATVGANNYINVSPTTYGDVRGAVDYNGKLYIFKRHGIFAVEFQPTRTDSAGTLFPFIEVPNPVVPGVGTQSHKSIVKFTTPATHKTPGQELVFFVDQFGTPRIFDGITTLSVGTGISQSRDTTIMSLSDMEGTRVDKVWTVNYPDKNLIYCHMTSSTASSQHDTCWVLDYTTGFAWSRDSYADRFNCGALMEKTNGKFVPFFGNYTGKVMEMETGLNDNGLAITSYAVTGDLFNASPTVRSSWLILEIRGTTGSTAQNVNLDYYVDGDDTSSKTDSLAMFRTGQSQWGAFVWGVGQWAKKGLVTHTKEINVESKTLRIKFSNSTLNHTGIIEGFSIFSTPEGWVEE